MTLRPTQPRTVTRDFGPVWIWRDDLVEIVAVMREATPDLSFQAVGYSFDTPDDLANLPQAAANLITVTSADSRIRLELGPKKAAVSADDPDLTTRGMLDEVHRIATRHQRAKYRERTIAAIQGVLLLATIGAWALKDASSNSAMASAAFAALLLLLTASLVLSFTKPRRQAIVDVRTRAEAPLWLVRNTDGLITNFVVSVFFLIVGYLIPHD